MSTLENVLYLPVSNKKEWPWEQIEDNPIVFNKNNQMWPKISVITPSYNQGEFIEQTIRSVLLQGYPNLEYIIIDGGSTDETIDVIEKYSEHITYWVSEPDRGQSHAINKGLARATGEIICWLNSDDIFEPGALEFVGQYFLSHPEAKWLVGQCRIVTESGIPDGVKSGMFKGSWKNREHLLRFWEAEVLPQPSSFWLRELMEVEQVREDLHYSMDYELWVRFSEVCEPQLVDRILASYRMHTGTKTFTEMDLFLKDLLVVLRPRWWAQGINFYVRCEIGWRRHYAESWYRSAFKLGQTGERNVARRKLVKSIMVYPPCLMQWSILNLTLHLFLPESWVGRLRRFIRS